MTKRRRRSFDRANRHGSFLEDLSVKASRVTAAAIKMAVPDALWEPRPENKPQQEAFNSPADRLFYGGAAGGARG